MTQRLLVLLLLILAGLALATGMSAPESPPPGDRTATNPNTFTQDFQQHLDLVLEAGDALVDLGARRERNLLVVGQRQSAMNAALDATDGWLAQQPQHQDDPAVMAYRTGAASIRQAMADAQSAFLRFDWDGMAAANVTLNAGVNEIRAAKTTLVGEPG